MPSCVLDYENQVKKPSTFADEVPKANVGAEELTLVKTLIGASTPKKFELGKRQDHYTEKLTELIEKKVAGAEIVRCARPGARPDHQPHGR